MTGTALSWATGLALVTVVSVAVLRLTRARATRPSSAQYTDPLLHLLMALGMAVMLLPGGASLRTVLRLVFASIALGLLAWAALALRDRATWASARGGHRLHHMAMAVIMALMSGPQAAPGSAAGAGAMAGMEMTPPAEHGAPLTLLAAFAYAAGSACVIAWRLPTAVASGRTPPGRACGSDPVGSACEVLMLLSTAVILLPAI